MSPLLISLPQIDVWQRILSREISLASQQAARDVSSQGIVLSLAAKSGQVRTRGIGLPPWKKIVEDFKS